MYTHTCTNTQNHTIAMIVEQVEQSKGLAIVMHGLGGRKEQKHIEVIAQACIEQGYTTIRFDTVHTFGESTGGAFEDATITNFYDDLKTVIAWSKKQNFWNNNFILLGHSLGAIACTVYAEEYPQEVKALAPLSTVISGELSLQTKKYADVEQWKKEGMKQWLGSTGKIKRLKWSHMKDRMQYDILKDAKQLTIPVLMIVGELDESTPVEHQKMLYEQLEGKKEFHIIKNSRHTFKEQEHLEKLKQLLSSWLQTL